MEYRYERLKNCETEGNDSFVLKEILHLGSSNVFAVGKMMWQGGTRTVEQASCLILFNFYRPPDFFIKASFRKGVCVQLFLCCLQDIFMQIFHRHTKIDKNPKG